MRKPLIAVLFSFFLTISALAQKSMAPLPEEPGPEDKPVSAVADSILADTAVDPSLLNLRNVFDIYWVNNSIKCGWKSSDTSLIGSGVELCDTVHPFIMPVTGKFWRGCTSYHAGWDVGSDYGTPIRAALYGKVRYAGYCSGYGKLVIVRHYSGMEIYYAHLSKILVAADQYVNAGDTLGLVGATGRARGNHLHMEFRVCDRALDIADYYVHNDTVVNLYKIFDTSKKQIAPLTAEYHKVVRGDNLWDLSRRYGTTVSNLCSINGISRNSTLRIGQRLRIR